MMVVHRSCVFWLWPVVSLSKMTTEMSPAGRKSLPPASSSSMMLEPMKPSPCGACQTPCPSVDDRRSKSTETNASDENLDHGVIRESFVSQFEEGVAVRHSNTLSTISIHVSKSH